MKSHTNRQYRTYIKWAEEQWNKPSRTDNYLMAIEAELKIANGHKKVYLKQLIKEFVFGKKEEEKPKPQDDNRLKLTKSIWRSRVGMK